MIPSRIKIYIIKMSQTRLLWCALLTRRFVWLFCGCLVFLPNMVLVASLGRSHRPRVACPQHYSRLTLRPVPERTTWLDCIPSPPHISAISSFTFDIDTAPNHPFVPVLSCLSHSLFVLDPDYSYISSYAAHRLYYQYRHNPSLTGYHYNTPPHSQNDAKRLLLYY